MDWLKLLDRFRNTPFEYPPREHLLFYLLSVCIIAGFFAFVYFRRLSADKRRDWRKWWLPVVGLFVASYVVVFVSLYLYYRYWSLPPTFQNGEVGILVAEVPDEPNFQRQYAYVRAISDQFQKSA